MSSAAKSDDDGLILGINVTPLVDVTLVLLIVFMIVVKTIAPPAIPMKLPTASSANAIESVLRVAIDDGGRMTLDGLPVADGPALARAASAKARAGAGADTRAVIAASRSASHGAVVGAMDALRSAGIDKIAFAVERKN